MVQLYQLNHPVMPLLGSDRITLVRLLKVDYVDRDGFLARLSAIESDLLQADIITEVQRLIGLISAQEIQLQKATTKEAGLTKADVLEFSEERLCHIRSGRYENIREIARLIGWSFQTRVAGSF
jgi:hypothetical protein